MKFIKKHKKLLILILICTAIFMIYKSNNKNNINYTSLGDGFALGINSYGEINYGYSDYLRDYLKEKDKLNNYTKEFATPTMSIDSLYENIVINKKIKVDGQEINLKHTLRESEIITMSIGLNDLIYKLSTTENLNDHKLNKIIEEIDHSLDQLLKELKKYYPHEIYIVGYYNIETTNIYLAEGIKKLNELYQNKENVIYISTEYIFKKDTDYLSNPDSIYPNNRGYKAICEEIKPKITKKLEKN